jgi:hypothetical protein
MSSVVITLVVIAGAVVLGIALAYLPMRLVLSQMAKNVAQFIQRARDRRRMSRDTPDRRKVEEAAAKTETLRNS